jgi:hypothetical protein
MMMLVGWTVAVATTVTMERFMCYRLQHLASSARLVRKASSASGSFVPVPYLELARLMELAPGAIAKSNGKMWTMWQG